MTASKRYFLKAGVSFTLFLLLTAAVMTIDRQPIGPLGSVVGLATINGAFRDDIGLNEGWYQLSEGLGLVSIAVAGGFALLGLCQLIRRKSLRQVDGDILLLGGLYVAVAVAYVFFEIVVINCRPVLMEGALEASYPSSHTLLSMSILGAALLQCNRRIRHNGLKVAAAVLCVILMGFAVTGRLLSGVHWLTDILAGLLLALALDSVYCGLCCRLSRRTP